MTVNKVGKGKVIFVPCRTCWARMSASLRWQRIWWRTCRGRDADQVSGDASTSINRTDTGWVVTLFNNNGVFNPNKVWLQVDRNEHDGNHQPCRSTCPIAREWISDSPMKLEKRDGRSIVNLTIAPGGVAIVELVVHN